MKLKCNLFGGVLQYERHGYSYAIIPVTQADELDDCLSGSHFVGLGMWTYYGACFDAWRRARSYAADDGNDYLFKIYRHGLEGEEPEERWKGVIMAKVKYGACFFPKLIK